MKPLKLIGRFSMTGMRSSWAGGFATGMKCLALTMVFACLSSAAPVRAAEPDSFSNQLAAFDMRIAGDEIRTRIVIEFEQEPEFSYQFLDSPHRLVVDLPETIFSLGETAAEPRGLISDIRYGTMAPGRSRIVISSIGPMKAEVAKVMESETDNSFRLVFDLVAVSDVEFAELVESQKWDEIETGDTQSETATGALQGEEKPFTVAIDPGHGGIDAGARGRNGAQEKEITLALGKLLKEKLEADTGTRAILTRSDDHFVSLSERVRIARQHDADLFVSIHADSIRIRGVRGATVYTLSEEASDEMAHQLATQENRSDLLAGLSLEDEPDSVADILIDLTRRETQIFSVNLARSVVGTFDGAIKLINNPHRSAGFRVLRAPEVPSVLVELGYLSNVQDEKLLEDPQWRQRTADLLVSAILAYREKVQVVHN